MKKRVIDLTREDVHTICYNRKSCDDCPLNIGAHRICISNAIGNVTLKDLKKKVEVR